MHLEMLFPTRTTGLPATLFILLNLQQTTTKSASISQNVSPLLLSLLLLPSLSGCKALRDAKNPPTLQSSSQQNLPIRNNQNPIFTLFLKCLLYQLPFSTSTPLPFSFPSALESLTISLRTPAYSTPPLVTRWTAAPHNTTIAYSSRIHMDSRNQLSRLRKILKF